MHRLATIAIATIAAALCGCATQRAVVPVKATELLRTEKSWDGKPLPEYPRGTPELVVVRYEVAPGAKLGWHHHPSINYGIIEQGEITVIGLDGKETTFRAGDPAVEMVGTIHRGENRGNCATVINMFYISQPGVPIAVPHTELEEM